VQQGKTKKSSTIFKNAEIFTGKISLLFCVSFDISFILFHKTEAFQKSQKRAPQSCGTNSLSHEFFDFSLIVHKNLAKVEKQFGRAFPI